MRFLTRLLEMFWEVDSIQFYIFYLKFGVVNELMLLVRINRSCEMLISFSISSKYTILIEPGPFHKVEHRKLFSFQWLTRTTWIFTIPGYSLTTHTNTCSPVLPQVDSYLIEQWTYLFIRVIKYTHDVDLSWISAFHPGSSLSSASFYTNAWWVWIGVWRIRYFPNRRFILLLWERSLANKRRIFIYFGNSECVQSSSDSWGTGRNVQRKTATCGY